jgi:hypothetical protein
MVEPRASLREAFAPEAAAGIAPSVVKTSRHAHNHERRKTGIWHGRAVKWRPIAAEA